MRKWSRPASPAWPGSAGQRPAWLRAAGIVFCLVLGGVLYFSTGSILLAVLVGLGGLLLGVVSQPIIDHVPHRSGGRALRSCRRRREGNFRPAEEPAEEPEEEAPRRE